MQRSICSSKVWSWVSLDLTLEQLEVWKAGKMAAFPTLMGLPDL